MLRSLVAVAPLLLGALPLGCAHADSPAYNAPPGGARCRIEDQCGRVVDEGAGASCVQIVEPKEPCPPGVEPKPIPGR